MKLIKIKSIILHVTKLSPEICFKLRDARRSAKLGQSELAAEVGCKQSAISMFERGNPTKLGQEYVEKIAAKFKISLSEQNDETLPPVSRGMETVPMVGFCPNPECPTNAAVKIGGKSFFVPDRKKADPVGGRFCAMCGEVLEKVCPNCGAMLHDGAVCSMCGDPYVSA